MRRFYRTVGPMARLDGDGYQCLQRQLGQETLRLQRLREMRKALVKVIESRLADGECRLANEAKEPHSLTFGPSTYCQVNRYIRRDANLGLNHHPAHSVLVTKRLSAR